MPHHVGNASMMMGGEDYGLGLPPGMHIHTGAYGGAAYYGHPYGSASPAAAAHYYGSAAMNHP